MCQNSRFIADNASEYVLRHILAARPIDKYHELLWHMSGMYYNFQTISCSRLRQELAGAFFCMYSYVLDSVVIMIQRWLTLGHLFHLRILLPSSSFF